jgi:hypothetical protein
MADQKERGAAPKHAADMDVEPQVLAATFNTGGEPTKKGEPMPQPEEAGQADIVATMPPSVAKPQISPTQYPPVNEKGRVPPGNARVDFTPVGAWEAGTDEIVKPGGEPLKSDRVGGQLFAPEVKEDKTPATRPATRPAPAPVG